MSSEIKKGKGRPTWIVVFAWWAGLFTFDMAILVPGSYAWEILGPILIIIFAIFYIVLTVPIALLSWSITKLYPRVRRCLIPVICFGPIFVLVFIELFHRSVDVALTNGGFMRITPPSLWSSFGSNGSSCKIIYQAKDGKTGEIALYQRFMDFWPAVIIPTADGKSLLCLFSGDTDVYLLKVDLTISPKPFDKDSDLNWMVVSSSWYIELGTTDDWNEVRDYLKTAPLNIFNKETVTDLDLLFVREGEGQLFKESLLKRVEDHIYNLNRTSR